MVWAHCKHKFGVSPLNKGPRPFKYLSRPPSPFLPVPKVFFLSVFFLLFCLIFFSSF